MGFSRRQPVNISANDRPATNRSLFIQVSHRGRNSRFQEIRLIRWLSGAETTRSGFGFGSAQPPPDDFRFQEIRFTRFTVYPLRLRSATAKAFRFTVETFNPFYPFPRLTTSGTAR